MTSAPSLVNKIILVALAKSILSKKTRVQFFNKCSLWKKLSQISNQGNLWEFMIYKNKIYDDAKKIIQETKLSVRIEGVSENILNHSW